MGNPPYPKSNPRHHTGKVSEPKAQARFETSAEVLTGLVTAFDHYETMAEPAMR